MKNIFFKKIAWLLALVGLFMFSGVSIFQLQVAFGWNNPTTMPPGGSGALTAGLNGQVGINTPNPVAAKLVINASPGTFPAIDTVGSDIIGLPLIPVATGAASKEYVDAQVAGAAGGGKGLITIYGASTQPNAWAEYSTWVTQSIKTCLLGTGKNCNLTSIVAAPGPGQGITCPTTAEGAWSTVFSGYGPYAYLNRTYFYRTSVASGGPMRADEDGPLVFGDPDEIPFNHYPGNQLGVTYSVCGATPYLVAQTDYQVLVNPKPNINNAIGGMAGVLTACVPQNGSIICNTCKICQAP